jgi:hemolysin III
LRGLLHQYAFFASLPALAALLWACQTSRATLAGTIYGLSLVALFGVSALYHRVTWSRQARRWMARLDHAMINVLIAGTFTPFGLLVLTGTLATASLAIAWGGALTGVLLHVFWIDAPRWVSTAVYLAVGWSGVAVAPQVMAHVGPGPTVMLALGGALYSIGAAVYALRRPDPAPATFGYHEVFHALVIAAAISHYTVVAFWVLPRA